MNQDQLYSLVQLISAKCITPAEYIAWSESKILTSDNPEEWIVDLCLIRRYNEAAKRVRTQLLEISDIDLRIFDFCSAQVCFDFIQFQLGLISWDLFLEKAIALSSVHPCGWPSNDFKKLLDAFLENEKHESIEKAQSEYFEGAFEEDLQPVRFYISHLNRHI
ncbi:hypothetical protein NFHSH190041_23270 [Shewanella sp. NFH-SH190041]|uniref:hypothetical protein n=1 Tax=Shewanella sp. NFH-SH190041 TaxID=2950245 RepID=UPI0021C331AF|nr:hypothetical protein [Shewanella sp. NFH-SH190041]BDM64875.1 hypothetical protein NFHSH190041_23270 [Shewanella sp. NFH-SH190041]